MKKISIVSSCFNEEENVELLYEKVKSEMEKYRDIYEYEQILVDNGSTDKTADVLKKIAADDKNVKVIINSRNFGHIRSPYYAIINASGDAVIYMASDLQDPPEFISEFIRKWEDGSKIVLARKIASEENKIMSSVRKLYYFIIRKIADDGTVQIDQCTGFGLYDRQIVEIIKDIDDPYPYIRGILAYVGYSPAIIPFKQQARKHGVTHNNFYTLFDNAMIGITNHSKVPLRMATFLGFLLSLVSLLVAFYYFVYKLVFWDTFQLGVAPLVIGLFFFSSIQLFFIGIIGEYIGAIYTRIDRKPVVCEKERINF